MGSFKELDFVRIKGVSIDKRRSKVTREHVGTPPGPDATFEEFIDGLPDVLGAADLKALASQVVAARRANRPVVWMIGGHVIKCGVAPYIADLMNRGLLTAIAMNGAAAIHDIEMTVWGHTSEDVETALGRGEFGMTEETAQLMNGAVSEGSGRGWGIGESLGRALEDNEPLYPEASVLLTAWRLGLPATVHVALGTDVVHQHASLDPEAVGRGTYIDFKVFAGVVSDLAGGVAINVGSAVIMPEVFLKACSIATNLGRDFRGLVTANLDFFQHYRPTVNVLRRPVPPDGKSYALTGHHEILVPLLASAIKLAAREGAGKTAG